VHITRGIPYPLWRCYDHRLRFLLCKIPKFVLCKSYTHCGRGILMKRGTKETLQMRFLRGEYCPSNFQAFRTIGVRISVFVFLLNVIDFLCDKLDHISTRGCIMNRFSDAIKISKWRWIVVAKKMKYNFFSNTRKLLLSINCYAGLATKGLFMTHP
jgi:hypothetical protein